MPTGDLHMLDQVRRDHAYKTLEHLYAKQVLILEDNDTYAGDANEDSIEEEIDPMFAQHSFATPDGLKTNLEGDEVLNLVKLINRVSVMVRKLHVIRSQEDAKLQLVIFRTLAEMFKLIKR